MAAPLDGLRDSVDGLVLADHPPVQGLREVQQLLALARHQPLRATKKTGVAFLLHFSDFSCQKFILFFIFKHAFLLNFS